MTAYLQLAAAFCAAFPITAAWLLADQWAANHRARNTVVAVSCAHCISGGVPTGDPAQSLDACGVCDGTGLVSYAAWLAGQEVPA